MKHIFLKFPSGRTFLAVNSIEKVRNLKRTYILFFDEAVLKKNFEIDVMAIKKCCECFFSSPTKFGIRNITKKAGNFNLFLCTKQSLKDFFIKEIFPILKENNQNEYQEDYIILSEEPAAKNPVIEIKEDICPVFYNFVLNELLPVSYSPFSYHVFDFAQNEPKKEILSLGNESDFTIAYLDNDSITVSPNFGELESLYEIDAMDVMVNSIIGHMQLKNITIVKDYNTYSMISDYTSRFSKVKNVSHIYSHAANVMLDNDFSKDKGISIIYDSISYGLNDQIQGSKIIYGCIGNFKVAGGWKPIPLPGGDIANIEPWRIALAVIKEAMKVDIGKIDIPLIKKLKSNTDYNFIFNAINQKDISYTLSSSMHHIIAALGEILSFEESTYEFEFFENKLDKSCIYVQASTYYPISIIAEEDLFYLDSYDLFRQIISDILDGLNSEQLICKVVASITIATCALIEKISQKYNEKKVFLSGEFFKHPHFLTLLYDELLKKGFKVYVPKIIPLDDSGVSVGQLIYHYYEKR